MKHLNSIINHAIDKLNDINSDEIYKDDLHHTAFNEDYFIIGYHQANEWLKDNDIDTFEAIAYVMKQDLEMFGEIQLKVEDLNAEKIVNLYSYYKGQELIYNLDIFEGCEDTLTGEDIENLINELETLLND